MTTVEATRTNRDAGSDGEVIWDFPHDRLVVSPAVGGRVMSWRHRGGAELVKQPSGFEGGLLRVLVGEERYPGASCVTPHIVVARNDQGPRPSIHLRYAWGISNVMAGLLGWPEKTNPRYLDGLWLDKVVSFDPEHSALLVELAITNHLDRPRIVSPWLHNYFHGWAKDGFVIRNGKEEPYIFRDPFWAGHPVDGAAGMRLVAADAARRHFAVLGGSTRGLTGMAAYYPELYGPTATDCCLELRSDPVTLAPGQRWVGNAFVAMTDDWRQWADRAPIELGCRVEPAEGLAVEKLNTPALALLDHWALPQEMQRGAMVISHLDKVPFTGATRYAAANAFAGFHRGAGGARADVAIYALRGLTGLKAQLRGPQGWSLGKLPGTLKRGRLASLTLIGPANLAGKEQVEIRLTDDAGEIALLNVPADVAPEPRYPHQLKPTPQYYQDRWDAERVGFRGQTAQEFLPWQKQARKRLLAWARNAVIGPAPLSPRLMERQVGPHCVRDKVVIQTEPGMWIPMYVVYPRNPPIPSTGRKMPGILFACGSGPGKMDMAPDETEAMQDPSTFNDWPTPYQFAHRLGCLVVVPDRRGAGELAGPSHSFRNSPQGLAGFNQVAMETWDHLRVVNYLLSRPDVDPRHVFCMGSSGGGWTSMFMAGLDERVAGGIVSSTITLQASVPEDFYFLRLDDNHLPTVHPLASLPLATAAVCSLAAPRPVWVLDGKWDTGVLPPPPHTPAQAQAAYAEWHRLADLGRGEIARAFELLGAADKFKSSWFDGGHLAGFNFNNISAWLKQHWGIERLR